MTWWRRRPSADTTPEQSGRAPDPSTPENLRRIARAHLSDEVATTWLSLLRPAIRLETADAGQSVVARLGGRPRLPSGFEWPTWQGHGPLAYVGEIDLADLSALRLDLDIELPTTGRLLAFYFDGSYDDFVGVVGPWDPDSLAGARLLHVTARREDCIDVAAPPGVLEFEPQVLTGRPVTTYPSWEHPALRRVFGGEGQEHREWMAHPVNSGPFLDALEELASDGPRHQVGGWADPQQGPIELEVAQAELGGELDPGAQVEESFAWSLLLQVDSDDASTMMWGDVGMLYWALRTDPAVTSDALDRTSFTWQCG